MIEAKHGEHKIKYDEENNAWRCDAMRCSAPSLAALRTKLNAEDREDRRISNIRAFSLDRGYEGVFAEVVITMIDTGRYGVNGYRVGNEAVKKREFFSLSSLVILNEKNLPKIERYKKASDAVEAVEKELEAARADLPKTTTEELKKLSVKARCVTDTTSKRHFNRSINMNTRYAIDFSRPGRMMSGSKRGPEGHICVWNANLCIKGEGKIWFGDLDLTDATDLKRLAAEKGKTIHVLREMDARFMTEASPRYENAVATVSPEGEIVILER